MSNITREGPTEEQWKVIESLLPPEKPKTGRPNKCHRLIILAILWILRTGAPWRDLPERFGPWETVYSRFYRWTKKGIWKRVEQAVRQQAKNRGQIDWRANHIDATVVRAHQHSAGARKIGPDGQVRTPESLALGRSKGGLSTKIHLRVEGGGKPMNTVLTPGQTHESTVFEKVMEESQLKDGQPMQNPEAVVGDKGYSAGRIREYLEDKHIQVVIPHKSNEHKQEAFDQALYQERNQVERAFNRFKQCRRLATRYEKLAETFLSLWLIASMFIWL